MLRDIVEEDRSAVGKLVGDLFGNFRALSRFYFGDGSTSKTIHAVMLQQTYLSAELAQCRIERMLFHGLADINFAALCALHEDSLLVHSRILWNELAIIFEKVLENISISRCN